MGIGMWMQRMKPSKLKFFLWIVLFCLTAGCCLVFKFAGAGDFAFTPLFWLCSLIVTGGTVGYFIFLCISSLFAPRWQEVFAGNDLPGCSVIVPAYNEGKHIFFTIETLLQSDYPPNKIEIITINDGSSDDTYYWQLEAQKKAPERINIIDFPENKGKKYALSSGIRTAKYDFIVTVDSDTVVKKDALRKLIQPFADERNGAVAGTITGRQDAQNIHNKMLDVMLVFGCEFLRKAQASAGNFFCTPGALSAYRKSAVMPVLEKWLAQTFLGTPAAIGEDRAIATLLLASGYRVVHQQEAEAETNLPETFCGVCKMLLRWTRSDVRENILMTPAVLRSFRRPDGRSFHLALHWIALNINMLIPFLFFPVTFYIVFGSGHPAAGCAVLCLSSCCWSLIPGIIYVRKKHDFGEMIWAFCFGFYSLLGLSWIGVYAFLTMRNSKWLTRGAAVSKK